MGDQDHWDRRYAADPHLGDAPADEILVRVCRLHPPGRALDLACGTGRNSIEMARAGWSVLAVDISPVALSSLVERGRQAGVAIEPQQADLTRPEFYLPPASFDLICDCRYLNRSLLPKMADWLRPGGMLIFVLPMLDDDPLVPPMNPSHLVSPGELKLWFATGFDLVEYGEIKPGHARRRLAQACFRKQDTLDKHPEV